MRYRLLAFLPGVAAALLLAACGGNDPFVPGGGGGGGTVNHAPTANAGVTQSVSAGVTVTLSGSASADSDGTVTAYAWTQTAGTPAVTLTGASNVQTTFTAPTVATATTLTFSLIVTDDDGAASAASTVVVTINPAAAGNASVTGRIMFMRVPFAADPNAGLSYGAAVAQPSRGITVEAFDPAAAAPQPAIASTFTDTNGNYTLAVPNNTTIRVRAISQMLRDSSQPLPRWNMRAQDGVSGTPYTYTDGASFNSSAGGGHDVTIPTGFNPVGGVSGTRASAPFAVLDTVYQAMQTILTVAPTTNFPTLVLDWAEDNPGGQTFFDPSGASQHIVLSAKVTEDTDEFDQHVIAHEFGHYVEFNYSRADNIGGSHGLGDKLDIRVAFGEGFGYAFAAIVLNDPVARDSYVGPNGELLSSTFNVETNPTSNPVGATNGNFGCWCSESTVWSVLWDLYDNAADANDNVALGFAPLWNVLIGPQRTTPAFTSIFSFITALKAAQPASAAVIDTLVAAQNITSSTMDAYGSTETHVPTPVAANGALPVYTPITIGGGPVVVQSVNDAGTHNTLGNHRYLKFDVASQRSITINVTSANPTTPDPDFRLWRAGTLVMNEEDPPAATETGTTTVAAGSYVLDVYECANGCDQDEGTSGDYNLTVTVN